MPSVAAASKPGARGIATASRVALVGAYAVLGTTLLWSRLFDLGHSFWNDEILLVQEYVRAGPRFILTGPTINHELMALLSWGVSQSVGESEVALRLLSAVPFVGGVLLVTAWLHTRLDPLAGVLFLFLATVSPLLLDITRQARGYGLAFLATSVVVVAALEALRSDRVAPIVVMCAAGVLGAWTLPQVAIVFVVTGAVLLLDRRTRLPSAVALVGSIAAIGAWYAPHAGAVGNAAQIPDGVQIGFPWVITAPIDQIVLPALLWIDGTALVAGPIWLPAVLLVAIVAASSPLLHEWRSALVLCAGAIATVTILWIDGAYVIPRYLSFLLAPLFIALASGAASILGRIRARPALLRSVVCVVVIGVLGLRFATLAPDVVGLPREAHRDVAEVIEAGPPRTPVLAYSPHPSNLAFYLGRPVRDLDASSVVGRVCGATEAVFYVEQPYDNLRVEVPCLTRPGVRSAVFRQYARGGQMGVWYVPPSG
jgi:hypothetical protein